MIIIKWYIDQQQNQMKQ
jgi:hypothetical protein